uniref:Aminopeptidase n=1 Tax=Sphaeramia orbicularis TaxID=375764 RepID=A0A672ZKT2_9TELE
MGKGFFISKAVGVVLIIVGAGALATIIALSVVYSQEKAKNNEVSPTHTWDKYRLPTTLKPDHYNLTLRPHLKPDPTTQIYHFTGNGSSSVEFICESETDLILIHSNKLIYYNQTNGQMTETQYLVIQLDGNLMAGQRYQLHTEFIGELADDLGGFYRSEYKENGETKVVATTQMQPTDARKAFPCFDEPAMKAVFYITLIHDINTTALSNENIVIDGETLLKTVFKPTERMSTYLLAFIVSDFGYIQNSVDGVLVRIFARKSAIDAGQGQYALNKTGPILKFFEQYYNSSYPLPKSDQIALPDFNAGAMENWGLITYRETALLYDEEYSSNSNKERIATIIAHELAHMWFGNLVTLRWWNDLWLNEGFASYVEYLGADNAEPEWKLKDLIVLNDVHRVFAIDALTSSHPLSSREEDIQRPEQISELFDAISYSKGASVLRMLSDFLTEEVFQHGLQTYLKTFQFQNAVYTDLWHHLQMAVDLTESKLNVSKIMNTWVLQMGYPVVTINTATGVVSQKHFLLDPDSEVTVKSEFKYKYKNKRKQITIEEMKASGDAWVLANHLVAGYYRVNYDDGNWNKLLNILNTNRLSINRLQAQLIDDAFNLARAKIVRTELALETTKYLRMETDFMPWESALDNLDFFYLMFDRSEVYGYMQDYLRNQVTPLFNYYKTITENWSKVPTGHLDQYNQVNAITLACKTGHPECITLATTWFKDWMTTEQNKIHPNLRSTVYCNAIAAGGADEWEFAWKKFQNATIAIEADKLRYALSCTKQPWLLNRYLEYTLEPKLVRKQDATSTIVYIAGNVVGQPLAWDFVRARWEYIFNQYGGGSFSFSNLINGVTKRFSTEFELQQLEQFKKDNADVGFGSGTLALDQSMERTRSNIKWLAENQENVLTWFKTEAER